MQSDGRFSGGPRSRRWSQAQAQGYSTGDEQIERYNGRWTHKFLTQVMFLSSSSFSVDFFLAPPLTAACALRDPTQYAWSGSAMFPLCLKFLLCAKFCLDSDRGAVSKRSQLVTSSRGSREALPVESLPSPALLRLSCTT